MKPLREQIIEILDNNIYKGVLHNLYAKIADDILALGWYPKEFVEYILKDINNSLATKGYYRPKGLDELYNNWKKLPK